MRATVFGTGAERGGLILAGMMSGSGKTAVASLLLAAWKVAGQKPRPFKVGPDYLDTGYHAHFAGEPSRNLDPWLMGEEGVLEQASAGMEGGGLGLVEGVMGLMDGANPDDDFGSTLHVARLLGWPVVMVAPCAKVGRSLGAALRGFRDTADEAGVRMAGVILNAVGGDAHAAYLCQALEPLHLPILGAVPHLSDLTWPERHLGLQASLEQRLPAPEELAALARTHLDLEALRSLATTATIPRNPSRPHISPPRALQGKTIALARDAAFHFYYPGNLDFLRSHGATLVEFSPVTDACVPEKADAVWLGGGFPELYAEQLSGNHALRGALGDWARSGHPLLAECGGLMFLSEAVTDVRGKRHPMVGVVPGHCRMTARLQQFGYSLCLAEGVGAVARGHEFHYSLWEQEADHANLWRVRKHRGGRERREGFLAGNVRATYVHTWFPASPAHALTALGATQFDNDQP